MSDEVVAHERRRGKDIQASKTFWLNAITAAIAVLLILSQSPTFTDYGEWLFLAQSILNVILRVFFTNQPVKL